MVRPVLLTLALSACAGPEGITGIANRPGGNPLVPDVALYPFPSDLYLVDGRLEFPAEALPDQLTPEMFHDADGASRVPPILTWLTGGFDPDTLPALDDVGATTRQDSPVLLVDAVTLERLPALVELDRNTDDPARQALIVRPHRTLDASATYVVVLRDDLRRADGSAHRPTEAFRALRDGIPTDHDVVESMRADFGTVTDVLDGLHLEPAEVLLAWSFTTRSEEGVSGPLLAMHDAMATADLGGWTPLSDQVDGARRVIEGSFTVPNFLDADSRVVLAGGAPVQQGTRDIRFILSIPETVDQTRPVIAFGHGFFSAREEITWSSLDSGLQQWEMSAIATDFIGFNERDILDTFGILGGDLSELDTLVAQQMQSQAQFTALARLVSEQLAADVVADGTVGPFHPLDAGAVHYMGISNGGTQGLSIVTASPAFRRAVLVVPGGGWSHMMQRAVQFNSLGTLLSNEYGDPRELQLVMSMMQLEFDPIDSLNWVPHLVDDRFDGRPPLQVTLHEAVFDSQVANLVTHWAARTAGVGLITPSPLDVWGLDPIAAPSPLGAATDAALFVYDEGVPPIPPGNLPPPDDNGTHDTVRDLASYKAQVGAFLEDGTIVQVCDGPCDPD